MDMSTIRAFMSRRVMGVPVMVFVLIGTAVLLFFALRMRNTSSDTTDTVDTTDTPAEDTGLLDSTQQPDFSAIPSGGTSATPVVTTTATNDTNDMWKRRAIEYLLANGYNLDVATNSISKYLNGEALTSDEAKARDAAIKQVGLPPEDIPDTILKSDNPTNRLSHAPASKQGEPPLNHEVKGANDNNPSELAVLYYGTNSDDAVNKIKAANSTKVTPYAVGTKVHIPANYYPKYFRATGHTRGLYDIARKNSVPAAKIEELNPGMKFPVDVGTRVRVK